MLYDSFIVISNKNVFGHQCFGSQFPHLSVHSNELNQMCVFTENKRFGRVKPLIYNVIDRAFFISLLPPISSPYSQTDKAVK